MTKKIAFKICQYIITFSIVLSTLHADAQRVINIDINKEKGTLSNTFNQCVGAGRAYEGLGKQWQNQLTQIKKDCDFKYIRFHGLLNDEMGIYKEDAKGNAIYNWKKMDKLFDFLLKIKMKPFVELSFMPSALRSNDRTVFEWKGYVSPPNSYPKYELLIEALVRHLEDRYGKREIKTWYFEVWNEPNHPSFFTGNIKDYFKLYETTARAIKNVDEDYRVGGPATAGTGWTNELMDFTKSNRVPLDFISTHAYGAKGDLDETGKKVLTMMKDPDHVANSVEEVRRKIEASSYKGLELHFTEWSSSYSPRDAVHDTYQNATYVLNTIKKTESSATSMSYWVFTDIFEELGQSYKPLHGGFGLMTIDNLKKPTYFVYKYLNRLGKTELTNTDKASYVCKSKDGVQALIWDFSYPDQKGLDDARFYTKEIPSLDKGKITISIQNLKDGKYTLNLYQTSCKHNDIFTKYAEIGAPEKLSPKNVKQLSRISKDLPVETTNVLVKNGTFSYDIAMKENDFFLFTLKKDRD